MAISLSSLFKKKSEFMIEFRGKMVEYKIEEQDGLYTLFLGLDGKVKNSWKDQVWVRVEYDTNTGKITVFSSKALASKKDGKVLYANYDIPLYPDFFPMSDAEIQKLIEMLKAEAGADAEKTDAVSEEADT